jgi:hypothetical protein
MLALAVRFAVRRSRSLVLVVLPNDSPVSIDFVHALAVCTQTGGASELRAFDRMRAAIFTRADNAPPGQIRSSPSL